MLKKTSNAMIEGLETRTLFAAPPKIIGVIADNRGEVQLTSSRTLVGISKSTVKVYTQGPDNILGTDDDTRIAASVKYDTNNFRITIRASLPTPGTGYRVGINSKVVASTDGRKLDGEYLGTFPTGNGSPGGNFAVLTKNDRSNTPTARMSTSAGVISLTLRKDIAPNTVNNFLTYANSGKYDNVFFTRSENNPAPFVIQGGSLQITGTGTTASDVVATALNSPIADENPGGISNTIGTLAFAKGGANTATNQFFVNLADNSFLDPASNGGGFTVFAQIKSGLTVAQAINTKPTKDLSSQIGTVASSSNTGVDKAPVNDATLANTLNPFRDLQVIRRIALVQKLSPIVV